MRLNADLSRRVVVHGGKIDWVPSPIPEVKRRMLDRIGGETARATTIVSYEPNSSFRRHVHGGGEEFLVLRGTFSDEHGDFPQGCYIRNYPTSSHEPYSKDGCVILVKLHQMNLEDRTHVVIDTNKMNPIGGVIPLFWDGDEDVRMESWLPGATKDYDLPKGGEFFVVDGSFTHQEDELVEWSWLRMPPQSQLLDAVAGPQGCKLWIKTDHLADVDFSRYEAFDQDF